jgi:hypothetical protein
MTNLEVRETILADVARNLDPTNLMDLFGQQPVVRGPLSNPGGDVWFELDYGGGHVYNLKIQQRTWRSLPVRVPIYSR